MQSYRMSALAGLTRRVQLPTFKAAYPHCWLVLEAGVSRIVGGPSTLAPTAPSQPISDPLAVPLLASPQRAGQVTLGRGSTCDIILAEATVSAIHMLFMEAGPLRWTVRDASTRNGTYVEDFKLDPGQPCVLRDASVLRAGSVLLTYHEPEGFFLRLAKLASIPPKVVAQN